MFYSGHGSGGPVFLHPESHLLVLGPPRSGKTRSVVVPNILCADGPVIATSTKNDLIDATSLARDRVGKVMVFDPSGRVNVPSHATRVYWSPINPNGTYSEILSTTRAMIDSSMLTGQSQGYSHWVERAASLLAPLMHAAQIAGYEMDAVMGWLNLRECRDPAGILRACGENMALDSLKGILLSEDRERSGIFSTALGLLGSYNFPELNAQSNLERFDSQKFLNSRDTLYIVSPSYIQKLVAPVIVGLIDEVKNRSFLLSSSRNSDYGRRSLSLILDEMANVAPLGAISSILSEGASQKVLLLGALQDLSQARVRWGEASSGFVTLFGSMIVFPGIADSQTLHQLSQISGVRAYESVSDTFSGPVRYRLKTPNSRSRSYGYKNVLEPWQIARAPLGEAYLFRKYHQVSRVILKDVPEISPRHREL